MCKRSKLFLTWGRFFKYPECCISAFISRVGLSDYSPYSGTGFRPCCSCAKKVEGMSIAEANKVLGINVKFDSSDIVTHTSEVIDQMQSPDWIQLATKLGWTVEEYNQYLKTLQDLLSSRQGLPTKKTRLKRYESSGRV